MFTGREGGKGMVGDEKGKKGKIVFDKEFEKGEYTDVIGVGVVKSGEKIDCVHLSFGQVLPNKKEEEGGGGIIEHIEPISHVIMSETSAKLIRDGLNDALGEKEGGK